MTKPREGSSLLQRWAELSHQDARLAAFEELHADEPVRARDEQEALLRDRLRTLASFARNANVARRDIRVMGFSRPERLAQVLRAMAVADEAISAAALGDLGGFRQRVADLGSLCADDVELAGACAWRLRRLSTSAFFDLHMSMDHRRDRIRRSLSEVIQLLDGHQGLEQAAGNAGSR